MLKKLCEEKFRPVPFYFINTADPAKLTLGEAFRAMRQLKEAHFGGCILFNKPPDGFSETEYLGDFWFEMTGHFAEAARKENLELWINDGYDFPPGDAGGRIMRAAPHLSQQRIARSKDGHAVIKDVAWGFPAFEEQESSELFHKFIYEEYKRRLSNYFGDGIKGFFSDADNRRFNFFSIPQMPGEAYYPWSLHFGDLFAERFGYRLEPYLDALLNGTDHEKAYNYWCFAGELYQGWFKRNHEWCKRNGLGYFFHTSDTGPFARKNCLRSSVFLEGSYLELARHTDFPGTDHELAALDGGTHYDKRFYVPKASWGKRPQQILTPKFNETKLDLRAKYASAASFIHGKERTMCELFAATNFEASPQLLRRIAAWQLMQGINFFVPHAVHHRFFGASKYFAPPEFLHTNLRHAVRDLNDWISHHAFLASLGHAYFQGAVIDPTERLFYAENETDDTAFYEFCEKLNCRGILFTITDKAHASLFSQIFDPAKPQDLPEGEAFFDAGELFYLVREIEDGSRFLMAANLRNHSTLSGCLKWQNRSVRLELEPGEIAVIGGSYESFRAPKKPMPNRIRLSSTPQIIREKENLIPIRQTTSWHNEEEIPNLRLLIPSGGIGKLLLDGAPISHAKESLYHNDDLYLCIPAPHNAGEHRIEFTAEFSKTEPSLLIGDFNAEVKTTGDFARFDHSIYNLDLYLPEDVKIVLSPRSKYLRENDWSISGAPFYSGFVTYIYEFEGAFHNARLLLHSVHDICEVSLDGIMFGKAVWPPYNFELGNIPQGKHRLELRICNSAANELEGLPLPSGLEETPEIEFC